MKRIGKGVLIAVLCLAVLSLALSHKAFMRAFYPRKYTELVEIYAREYELDPFLVYAVIKCESNFNPDAKSDAGALGIMQITPETFAWIQTKAMENPNLSENALFDPETGIKYGALLLSVHLSEFKSAELALCAYHAGRGQLRQWIADGKLTEKDTDIDHIPFQDTRRYVKRVMETYKSYRKLYA